MVTALYRKPSQRIIMFRNLSSKEQSIVSGGLFVNPRKDPAFKNHSVYKQLTNAFANVICNFEMFIFVVVDTSKYRCITSNVNK